MSVKIISEGKSKTYKIKCVHYDSILEKLGYKVYQGSQYNESYYSISW